MSFFVGIDIGGTFTDVLLAEQGSGKAYTAKTLTTYDDPSNGVISALKDAMEQAKISASALSRVVHATTLATNLILEGKGARVGYVATEGFGDLLQMGRGKRQGADRFDLLHDRQTMPVERSMTIEARERMDRHGAVLKPLDEALLSAELKRLAALEPEAYAVCLMHSYANPAHEQKVAAAIRRLKPDAYVALSSEVWPEFREYERGTTTVMSAAVGPLMSGYLSSLEKALQAMGVRSALQVMQSSGGVLSAASVAKKPIQSVESGPAAGVIGAAQSGALYGCKDIICFDMGGTTAKAGLVRDGKPGIAHSFTVGGKANYVGGRRASTGFPIKIPTIDLAEVGAGGGSIAWVDSGGVLQVGPQSASSTPGPACYNRGGTAPTVTDANLVLGNLNADYFLGGKMRVHPELAKEAIERHVAKPLGASVIEAAAGIYEIVNANMAAAVRLVTVERGIDPADFTVIAFGGAGPAHIVEVVEEFNVKAIIIPTTPGLASAAGLLVSDMTADYVRTRIMDPDAVDVDAINALYSELETDGVAKMKSEGVPESQITLERQLDARFRFQAHELSISVPLGRLTAEDMTRAHEAFRALYTELYGVRQASPVQLVNFRSRIVGRVPKLELPKVATGDGNAARALKNKRPVYFKRAGDFVETPVYDRGRLLPGDSIAGPAVMEEPDSTSIVPPGYTASVGEYLQLVISKV